MNTEPKKQLQESLCERFESIEARVNRNDHLIHRGRTLTADIIIQVGDVSYLVRVDKGRLLEITRNFSLFQDHRFAVRGSLEAWSKHWEPTPAPGWHDIFSLTKKGEMTLEGEMQPLFAHLQYLKDVLSIPRAINRPQP